MENSELIPYIAVAVLVQCLILYFIILTALKSAGFGQAKDIKMIMRMKAKQLRKQGVSYQEIYDSLMDTDEEFWRKLNQEQ